MQLTKDQRIFIKNINNFEVPFIFADNLPIVTHERSCLIVLANVVKG